MSGMVLVIVLIFCVVVLILDRIVLDILIFIGFLILVESILIWLWIGGI